MRNRNINIVLGLGFGDEGKGVATQFLCENAERPLVVRFSGGHQVGHTAIKDGYRHVFSNFGSGTLVGAPTYWSEYCTVNPIGVNNEGQALRDHGLIPIIMFNANAMVTTPYDVYANQKREKDLGHGSVGVGFGTTIQRNEDNFKLYVRDLLYPQIRDEKLKNIAAYYGFNTEGNAIKIFKSACDSMMEHHSVVDALNEALVGAHPQSCWDIIFEGSQGILLDMDYGFFPNVTRSHTTSKNVWEILQKHNFGSVAYRTYYVSRAYQTRHGNGFMTNESSGDNFIKPNPFETNVLNEYQGAFRKSPLDIDLLRYSVSCDAYHNRGGGKYLFLTCLDQVDPDGIPATMNGGLSKYGYREIPFLVGLNHDYSHFSFSDDGTKIFNENEVLIKK